VYPDGIGIKQSWNFCCRRSYWQGPKAAAKAQLSSDEEPVQDAHHVRHPRCALPLEVREPEQDEAADVAAERARVWGSTRQEAERYRLLDTQVQGGASGSGSGNGGALPPSSSLDVIQSCGVDDVRVLDMKKVYPGSRGVRDTVAIRNLALGFSKGECFGLLGRCRRAYVA
jgi:hypothetical protein